MWKWRELLPPRRRAGQPRRSAKRRSSRCRTPAAPNLLVKDEGRLPTGSFKARGLAMAVTMARQFGIERIAMPTNGNAGAALAAYGARAGIETIVICPAETPEINVTETAAYGARVYVADGQIDECGALVGKGAAAGPVVRLLDAEGALPARGQEGDGLRARRAARLGIARRDLLPDRRRHRPDRHVEGVRRAGGGRADRPEAAADVRGPGRRLRADRPRVRAMATSSPSGGRMRRPWRPASACPRRSAIS